MLRHKIFLGLLLSIFLFKCRETLLLKVINFQIRNKKENLTIGESVIQL